MRSFFRRRLFDFGVDPQRIMGGLDGVGEGSRGSTRLASVLVRWGDPMGSEPNTDPIRTVTDGTKRTAIMAAIASLDVPSTPAWNSLDELSSRTMFEEIDAAPEGIFERTNDDFEAEAIVYITLDYGGQNDSDAMSDSYPAHFRGTYDQGAKTVSITNFTVDTSSFCS